MNNELNLPPFYVGQKVVCVDNKSKHDTKYRVEQVLKIGVEYTVKDVRRGCCTWLVDVGFHSPLEYTVCYHCGKERSKKNTHWFISSHRFAPVQENFQSISLEKVLEKETALISVN